MDHNQTLGRRGEDAAARWYAGQGYAIIDRNWRCPAGEIDLIAGAGDTVVFIEVKTRSSRRYGSGLEAVTAAKQRRIRTVARAWLAQHDGWVPHLRFDVVDVDARGTVEVREGCF